MPDQASELRQLAMRRKRVRRSKTRRPPLLVVAGGKGGVGTTTVALAVARSLARAGGRVLFIDADAGTGNAAALCRVYARHTLADVLAGRMVIGQVASEGPDGVRLVAASPAWHERFRTPSAAARRLLRVVSGANTAADVVVLDVGNPHLGAASPMLQHADDVLLVTTADVDALVATVAVVRKLSLARSASDGCVSPIGRSDDLYVVLNKASSATAASAAYQRLAWTCRRLLGIEPQFAGYVKRDGILAVARHTLHRRDECSNSCPIGKLVLNPPHGTVDTMRKLFTCGAMSKWRSRGDLDGDTLRATPHLQPVSAGPTT